jgi:drug/metabolite transporter (DMT)-like permease
VTDSAALPCLSAEREVLHKAWIYKIRRTRKNGSQNSYRYTGVCTRWCEDRARELIDRANQHLGAMSTAGFLVATVAPFFCTVGITLWDLHWTSGGGSPYMLNVFKGCTMSIIFLAFTIAFAAVGQGGCWSAAAIGWLILSSLLGIVIGDTLWLVALRHLGAREMILIDSIKPFMLALFAWGMLGEAVQWPWWLGCIITTGAVGWVSLERADGKPSKSSAEGDEEDEERRQKQQHARVELADMPTVDIVHNVAEEHSSRSSSRAGGSLRAGKGDGSRIKPTTRRGFGFACAALNVLFDQLGAVLTKKFASSLRTWEINLVRFGFAAIFLLLPLGVRAAAVGCGSAPARRRIAAIDRIMGRWHELPPLRRRAWALVFAGCLSTTLACPMLTTWALLRIDASLYGVLTSTGPLYALPVVFVLKGERSTCRAVCGALLAVCGVVILSTESQLVEFTDGGAGGASMGASANETTVVATSSSLARLCE